MHKNFTISGTHCPACKALIEEVCLETPGVIHCEVDHLTGKTQLEHDETLQWEDLKQEIEGLAQYQIIEA